MRSLTSIPILSVKPRAEPAPARLEAPAVFANPATELLRHVEAERGVGFELIRTDAEWSDGSRTARMARTALRISVPPRPLQLLKSKPKLSAITLAWLATALALLGSLVLLLAAIGGLGRQAPAQEEAAVDIELGPPSPIRPPQAVRPALPREVAVPPAAPPVVAELPAPAPPAAETIDVAEETVPADLSQMAAVREAFAKAVESGAAEKWQENGLSGYVVLGPSNVVDRSVCRNVAIWIEPVGPGGQVLDGRKCLAPGGQWIDSSADPEL